MFTIGVLNNETCSWLRSSVKSLCQLRTLMLRDQTTDGVSHVLGRRLVPLLRLPDAQALRQSCKALQSLVEDVAPKTWTRMARWAKLTPGGQLCISARVSPHRLLVSIGIHYQKTTCCARPLWRTPFLRRRLSWLPCTSLFAAVVWPRQPFLRSTATTTLRHWRPHQIMQVETGVGFVHATSSAAACQGCIC